MSDEEHTTARLLQLSGARSLAPADRAARVRATVHRRWRSNGRRRTARRNAGAITALLAAAAAVVLAIRMTAPHERLPPPLDVTVATSERIEGAPVLRRQLDGRRTPLTVETPLRAEDVIATDHASRAAVRAVDGSSVRLDRRSRARLISPTAIELIAGAVYISTAERSRGFEVRTSFGAVHDVGTQFEVRLQDASLRVRVRTGLVEIRRGGRVLPTRAGAETTVTSTGIDLRSVRTYGSDWEWTSSVAPPFEIEGRSLHEYLDHVTREEGWTLRYENRAVADAASRIVLHGTMNGLRTDEALAVALATSGLQHRFQNGALIVFKPAAGR
jgi:ferric-dicitrate binding protein FerR (iron transport regulator)